MIENGHFRELQSIIDMLPMTKGSEGKSQQSQNCVTVSSLRQKKRQTLVFSATISLSADFRKKLKHGVLRSKQSTTDGFNSIETLSERAGMKANVAIVDLTNASVLAKTLEESFIEYVYFLTDSWHQNLFITLLLVFLQNTVLCDIVIISIR